MNKASGGASTASGRSATATGLYSTVSGGLFNGAVGDQSVVTGGWDNTALSSAAVGGGFSNTASGDASGVLGGAFNGVRAKLWLNAGLISFAETIAAMGGSVCWREIAIMPGHARVYPFPPT